MMGDVVRVVDQLGQSLPAALDAQRIVVEVDREAGDIRSAPETVVVVVSSADGFEEVAATRVRGGDPPPDVLGESFDLDAPPDPGGVVTYRSEPFSIREIGVDVESGRHVTLATGDAETTVQAFASVHDAEWWYTRDAIAGWSRHLANTGMNLASALKEVDKRLEKLDKRPDSEGKAEEQAKLEALKVLLEENLDGVCNDRNKLGLAERAFNDDDQLVEQRYRTAQAYLGYVGTDRDFRDDSGMFVHGVVERQKDKVLHRAIVDSFHVLTLSGYELFTDMTVAGPVYTLVSGESVLGIDVGWKGRALAFIALLFEGAVLGTHIKANLDRLTQVSKPRAVGPKPARYTGKSPETRAPSGAIVDPTTMGMTPAAMRAANLKARQIDGHILVRPTTPSAPAHLAEGALPKPESLKSKTISEVDTLLGASPSDQGLVGLFEPKTDFFDSALRSSGLSDADRLARLRDLETGGHLEVPSGFADPALWNKTVKRYHQRTAEFTGATGMATRKLIDEGVIRIEDGVIINAEQGVPYTGDPDMYDVIGRDGNPVSTAVYDDVVATLQANEFRAQHGAHARWNPQRSDFPPGPAGDAKYEVATNIYETIIRKHQGEEILIAFGPSGPPIALFAGETPKPYFGMIPSRFKPAVRGSSFLIPTELIFLGTGGQTQRPIEWDDEVADWAAGEATMCPEQPPIVTDSAAAVLQTQLHATPAKPLLFPFRWILVGGGVGVLGLVLTLSFFVLARSGSNDPDPATQVRADEPAAVVEDQPAAVVEDEPVQDASSAVIAPPDYTADQVMVDLAMQGFLGISLLGKDVVQFLSDQTLPDEFALTGVDPPLRTSFFEDEIAEGFGVLGTVPKVTGVGIALLTFSEPLENPQAQMHDDYQQIADVTIPPGTLNTPAQNVLAVAVEIAADMTDPAVCGGKELVLVLNIHNPEWGDPYRANPRFPGEYYDGGNFFPNFVLSDCTPTSYADTFLDGEIIAGLATSGVSLLTAQDGVTRWLVLLSEETVNPDASLHTILFEHPVGEPFFPENTRYQSHPDIFEPASPISDGIITAGHDFTLVPITEQTPTTTTAITTTTTTTSTTTATSTTIASSETPDQESLVEEFVAEFAAATASDDTDFLLARLHPLSIRESDQQTCAAFVSREIAALDQYRATRPAQQTTLQLTIDGRVFTVDPAYEVPVAFTFGGQEFTDNAHFAPVDGVMHYFATCR